MYAFPVCTYVRMYVCTYVRMYVCTYVRTYVRMYVCTYVRMYVCMYVCMYVTLSAFDQLYQFLATVYQLLLVDRHTCIHGHIYVHMYIRSGCFWAYSQVSENYGKTTCCSPATTCC